MQKLPLYQHRNGQWCKRVNGKIYYFGTELPKALTLYEKSKSSIAAGHGKITESPEYALHELADLYYDHKKQQVKTGDITQRSLNEIKKTLQRLCDIMGRTSIPVEWNQHHFFEMRSELFKPVKRKEGTGGRAADGLRSHTTVAGDIRRIKAFFRWCKSSKLIEQVDSGDALKEPPARLVRIERNKSTKGPMAADSIRAILDKCSPQFKPIILLGINGGLGAGDISGFTIEQLASTPLLSCPRIKTAAPRRIYLWPETQEAISLYMKKRKDPSNPEYSKVAFLTRHGAPWVTEGKDSATQMFGKTCRAAGIKGSFYDLRRTFQTIADETLDFPAVSFCMGHIAPNSDMAARYRQISDERIKRVCLYVRSWLFSD